VLLNEFTSYAWCVHTQYPHVMSLYWRLAGWCAGLIYCEHCSHGTISGQAHVWSLLTRALTWHIYYLLLLAALPSQAYQNANTGSLHDLSNCCSAATVLALAGWCVGLVYCQHSSCGTISWQAEVLHHNRPLYRHIPHTLCCCICSAMQTRMSCVRTARL
jgi:hypothetical protein